MRRLACLFAVLAAVAVPAAAQAMKLPPGFQARTLPLPKATSPSWSNGLQMPTTVDFAPDGKMFVAERNGRVLEFDSIEDSTPTLVLSILADVMAKGDRGILGMKLDPEYPTQPYLYLSYTYDAPIGGDSADSTHTHNADGSDDCEEGPSTSVDCVVSGRLVRVALNPATSVAIGGALSPVQDVLINSWCQQTTSHSIGDIEFDRDGALLMSGGDGASWGSLDYGQLGNPCGDPPDEGGSLRSQDVRTPGDAADPTDYGGSIIRVNPDTGAAMPDNPFSQSPLIGSEGEDVRARRILAYGLRNPYRFTIRPGTDDVYVGDVGQDLWEEIDRATSPPASGQAAVNFGWPCYEGARGGNAFQPNWHSVEKPLCESLYAEPSQVRAPFFAYPHPNAPGFDGHLFTGDGCNPAPGSAIAGLAFYDPAGVPAEDVFPPAFQGALFFSDAARGCIWSMQAGAGGVPDPSTVANFALRESGEPSFTPVDVVEGADGALYVPNFYDDSIVQIRYFPGNQAPTAQLAVDKTYGAAPLTVHFDASGSSDPDLNDGDHIHYAWDLDGDGQLDDAFQAKVEHTYSAAENVTVRVRVSDDFNHADVREVTLYPGDLGPPSASILAPSADLEWAIGETLDYEATATDPDGDQFDSATQPMTAHWQFTLVHCPSACHEHPLTGADSPSGSFVLSPHDYPSHLRLEFTAADSRGLSETKTVEVFPRLIEVGVDSDPAGIPLLINGVSGSGPFSATLIAGASATVAAPPTATVDGQQLVFSEWSDGGARVHEVGGLESQDLVARFLPAPPEEPGQGGGGGGSAPEAMPTPATVPLSTPTARISLASRPRGVQLRLGGVRQAAPFSLDLALGTRSFLLAPASVTRGAKVLRFKRWLAAGRTAGTARRKALSVSGDGRYVAVYSAGSIPRR